MVSLAGCIAFTQVTLWPFVFLHISLVFIPSLSGRAFLRPFSPICRKKKKKMKKKSRKWGKLMLALGSSWWVLERRRRAVGHKHFVEAPGSQSWFCYVSAAADACGYFQPNSSRISGHPYVIAPRCLLGLGNVDFLSPKGLLRYAARHPGAHLRGPVSSHGRGIAAVPIRQHSWVLSNKLNCSRVGWLLFCCFSPQFSWAYRAFPFFCRCLKFCSPSKVVLNSQDVRNTVQWVDVLFLFSF